jgi:aspartate/methionine/tyrosine aminotransferase
MVLSDEVYEHMTYDESKHVHFASLPNMFDRTITLFSAGKTFSTTGWRLGYSISSPHNIHHIKTLHSIINFSTTTTFQKVIAKAFIQAQESNYFPWLATMLQKKRDKLCASLTKIGTLYIYVIASINSTNTSNAMVMSCFPVGMKHYIPQGGYFVVADISEFYQYTNIDIHSVMSKLNANSPLSERPDVLFAKWLTTQVGVCPIPVSPFYPPEQRHLANNLIRLAYCKDEVTINTAIERLEGKFLKK